jgi:heat shock protein HspQ
MFQFVLKRHASQVKYAVGMVCYHKKFDYVGIIKAWNATCDLKYADRMEMELNLHFGMNQPFYYIMAADQSSRYVAEGNCYVIFIFSITVFTIHTEPAWWVMARSPYV